MPREDHDNRLGFYDICKKYLNENELCYIDVNDKYPFNKNFVRDTCHTTDLGGKIYAEYIFEEYSKIKNTIKIHTVSFKKKYPCMRFTKKVYMFPHFCIIRNHCDFLLIIC